MKAESSQQDQPGSYELHTLPYNQTKPKPLPLPSSESIFLDSEQTLPKILLNSFSRGLPTSFTYGDFYYCMITMRVILSATGQLSILAASAYSTAYFAICMHCLISATVDTNSTLGSQAFGKRNYLKLNLYLKQSIFVCFSLALVFVVFPCFFLDFILDFFGAQEDLVEDTKGLILWSMPGMLVRILGDNLKVYIQNQGQMREIGRKSFFVFCGFIPLSYILVGVYVLGAMGIGICLFTYELSCCLICFWIINRRCAVNPFKTAKNQQKMNKIESLLEARSIGDEDTPVEQLNFLESLPAYYVYTGKVFITRIGVYICWDSISVIVGLLNSKEQLAAFGIAFLLGATNHGTSRGVIVYNATIINEKLGKGQKRAAYDLYLKCFKSVILTGLAFASTCLAICLSMIYFGGFEDNEVKDIFVWVVPFICIHSFQACLYNLTLKMFYSLGYFKLAIYWQGLDFVFLGFNYYLTYLRGNGAPCAYFMPNIAMVIKNIIGIVFLQFKLDWDSFEGF